MCNSFLALFSSMWVSGARTLYRTLWPFLQLAMASSTLPWLHSTTPSCLHFDASTIESLSSSMVPMAPPFNLSSRSSLAWFSRCCRVHLNSQALKRSSMPRAPEESAVLRKSCRASLCSASSICSSKGTFNSLARCSTCMSKISTILYFSIGATNLLISAAHCSREAPTNPRLSFINLTLSNCSNHRFFLVLKCSSDRSNALA
mmetsp:Transcript_25426/g.85040  ORF Transcript_25426/g.85040 Transcript_25426/m.85040 type:complete len:203 (+) Transcript_25426:1440-2048(+)